MPQNPTPAPAGDTIPTLTPEREQEIRTLEQAATPGPWESDGAEIYGTLGGVLMIDLWVGETLDVDNQTRSNADAAFIATARSAVPELLGEVADLRAELADQVRATEYFAQQSRRRGNELERLRAELAARSAPVENSTVETAVRIPGYGDWVMPEGPQRDQAIAAGAVLVTRTVTPWTEATS